jgi:uncharacterized protein
MATVRLRPSSSNVPRFLLAGGAVIVLIALLRAGAGLLTDIWWFESVGFPSILRRQLLVRLSLQVGAFVFTLVPLLLTARRLSRMADQLQTTPRHDRWSPRLSTLVAAASAFVVAPILGDRWQTLLLAVHGWRESVPGPRVLGLSPGFYLFRLPLLQAITAWITALSAAGLSLVLFVSVMTGLVERKRERLICHASKAVSLLAMWAVLLLVGLAAAMWWSRFGMASRANTQFVGLFSTDERVRVPALSLLAIGALVVAGTFAVVLRPRRGSSALLRNLDAVELREEFMLPIVGVITWLTTAVITFGIVPSVYQSWFVKPNSKSNRELRLMQRHIDATTVAYGLDDLEAVRNTESAFGDLKTRANELPMWDEFGGLVSNDLRTKSVHAYYRFGEVDTGRYVIDGQVSPILIAPRNISPTGSGWVNQVLTYTHGNGVQVARATQTDAERLVYRSTESLAITTPQIYVSDGLGGYAITGTKVELSDGTRKLRPSTAVRLSNLGRRAAFSLRFSDLDVLRSGALNSNASVVFRRDVSQRVRTVAPMLRIDADPYPVVLDGRVLWVLDAYTVSDRFPGSQRVDADRIGLRRNADLRQPFNYIRHSAKAIVDASSGRVWIYRTDLADPVARVWNRAFPTLFRSADRMATDHPGIGAHLRYPSDLLRVQAAMFGRYHDRNPERVIGEESRWIVTPDTRKLVDDDGGRGRISAVPAGPGGSVDSFAARTDPSFRLVDLGNGDGPQWSTVQTLQTDAKVDGGPLAAMLVGSADDRGRTLLRVVRTQPSERGTLPKGLAEAAEVIDADEEVSRLQTTLGQKGSRVQMGGVIPLLYGDGKVLYARMLYVEASQQQSPPRLVRVIGYDGQRIVIASNTQAMLDAFAGSSGSGSRTVTSGAGAGSPTANDPVAALKAARAALADSERRLQEAQRQIDSLLRNLENTPTTSTVGKSGGAPSTKAPVPEVSSEAP